MKYINNKCVMNEFFFCPYLLNLAIQVSLPKFNNVELTHHFMNESEGWLLVLGGRGGWVGEEKER